VAVFFLAGHDTTANTLSFCLYHLAKNKHVQRKARADVLSILGDKPNDYIPTSEELKQMEYINMVIKEVNKSPYLIQKRSNTKESK
jgi:cytochrome P450